MKQVIKENYIKSRSGKVFQSFVFDRNILSQFRAICMSLNLSMSKVISNLLLQFIYDISNQGKNDSIELIITKSQYKKHQIK